jgi:phosphate transport system protein
MNRAHTSRDYEAELRELRAHSLAMGARCERSVQLALEAFWNGSHDAATEVEKLDRQIDSDEMQIDALVLRVLALRQPVAYDLRLLMTALKLVTDLERIGDEAVNIAERAKEGPGVAKEKVQDVLKRMSEEAQQMVREALEAFVSGDADRAQQVRDRDDAVDAAYSEVLDIIMTFMKDHTDDIPGAVRVMKVAKYVERIADHATNIAEEVIFMVRGEDVRHVRSHAPPAVKPS